MWVKTVVWEKVNVINATQNPGEWVVTIYNEYCNYMYIYIHLNIYDINLG